MLPFDGCFGKKSYMFDKWLQFFGGTNFGRTSGGPFYTTSYDYDAPIDEYGIDISILTYL
jgi:hypothetical protein